MSQIDQTPALLRFKQVRGITWNYPIRLLNNDNEQLVNLAGSNITAVIHSEGSVFETLKIGSGITLSADSLGFTLRKDWVSIAANGVITPEVGTLPLGVFYIQIYITSNGVDISPICIEIEVVEKSTDNNSDISTPAIYQVRVSNGFAIDVDAFVLLDQISDINSKLPNLWLAKSFLKDSIVFINGQIWKALANTTLNDIPGISPLWEPQITLIENIKVIISNLYKWAIDINGQVPFGIDNEDNLDARGITEQFAESIAPTIAPFIGPFLISFIKSSFGLSNSVSSTHKWGLDLNGQIPLGIDFDDNIDGAGISKKLAEGSTPILSSLLTPIILEAVKNALGFNQGISSTHKWAVDLNGQIPIGIDNDDNIDGGGVSQKLANSIANRIYPLIETLIIELLGYRKESSTNYKWALDLNGQVPIGVDKEDKFDASGITDRLISVIKEAIGFGVVSIDNNQYLFGIMIGDQLIFAITHDYKIVAIVDGIENLQSDLDFLRDAVDPEAEYVIEGWGDSLTVGAGGNGVTYLTELQTLLPPGYTTINCGVGGETPATICARLGSVPARFTTGFVLPSNTDEVEVSSVDNIRLKNKYLADVKPLIQGHGNSVNPCFVEDIECTISYNSTTQTWKLKRNNAGLVAKNIVAETPLVLNGSKSKRRAKIHIFWMGQNGGFSTSQELVDYIQACIDFVKSKDFIVLGLHTGTPASRRELEELCFARFGLRYINLRQYISTYALEDMNIIPTEADIMAMNEGKFPPSFRAYINDSTHGNENFYKAVGRKVFKRLQELGNF